MAKWLTCLREHTDEVHVVPIADAVPHLFDDCVCGPTTEAVMRDDGSNGWLVVHHSLDGRELLERTT